MKKKLIYIVTLTLTITACTQEAILAGKERSRVKDTPVKPPGVYYSQKEYSRLGR